MDAKTVKRNFEENSNNIEEKSPKKSKKLKPKKKKKSRKFWKRKNDIFKVEAVLGSLREFKPRILNKTLNIFEKEHEEVNQKTDKEEELDSTYGIRNTLNFFLKSTWRLLQAKFKMESWKQVQQASTNSFSTAFLSWY